MSDAPAADAQRYAVKLRAGVDADGLAALEARHGLTALRRIAPLRIAVYTLTPEAARALQSDPDVEYVEEDRTMTVR